MGLGPTEAEPDGEAADLRRVVDAAGVACHVKARNAEPTPGSGDIHDRVEDRRRGLVIRVLTVAARLEADRIDRGVNLRHTEDLLDLLRKCRVLGQVDGLSSETLGLL